MSALLFPATCTRRICSFPMGQPRYLYSRQARQAVCEAQQCAGYTRAGICCTCDCTESPTRARPQPHRHRKKQAQQLSMPDRPRNTYRLPPEQDKLLCTRNMDMNEAPSVDLMARPSKTAPDCRFQFSLPSANQGVPCAACSAGVCHPSSPDATQQQASQVRPN